MPATHNPYTPGQFYLAQHQIPDPAPGQNLIYMFPEGYTHQILALSFSFQCDGAAGNRFMQIGAVDFFDRWLFSTTHQTALIVNQSARFYVGAGFTPRVPTPGITPTALSWPPDLLIPGHNQLLIRVLNKQIGDQISDIYLIQRQWFST